MKTQDDFPIGTVVNVEARPDDMFIHDFTGVVVAYHGEFIVVRDQDDDCWDCEPEQLSYNSDEHMH